MSGVSIKSALVSVTDVDRSSQFYRELLNGVEVMRDDQVVTLGCGGDGSSIVFLRKALRGSSHSGQQALGVRALIWDLGSADELDRVESCLRAFGNFRGRRTTQDGLVQFVEGHDPDRLPLVFLSYQTASDVPAEHYRHLTDLMFALDR